MFRCMFAVTWYKYFCPNTMFAERRKRTTTCKKMFASTWQVMGILYDSIRRKLARGKPCDHADSMMVACRFSYVDENTLDSDPPIPSPSKSLGKFWP